MKLLDRMKQSLASDVNWDKAHSLALRGGRAAPRATADYVLEKVPIVQWLPRYNYRWLINDVVAGLTIGIMLIPQSLAYAKIATMPVQYGLMSSWLPGVLYAFMGTSKDLSTGPTSLIGLLTADIVKDLTKEGYTAQQVGTSVAMGMGVYGMALGFLKLGFLLDFVSTPVLNGFISAAAITIGLGQVGSLMGESNIGSGTGTIIHDIFHQLPHCDGYAIGVGFGGIILLVLLDQAGKRWGNRSKIIFYLSITRAFICLLLFTGISYAVNKHFSSSDDYLFAVAKVKTTKISAEVTTTKLFTKTIGRSIAPFVAAALEHVAIARAFGMRNNYVTDTSQELAYLGIVNLVNSFFHSMGVGGAMSRTAVNSGCKVRSPLSGFVTTAVVLVCIYELTGALYWIPKATLSAIVITAVWPLVGSWRTYYHYWRTSFTDFVAAMIAFWVSLFVSTEVGIGSAVGWSIAVVMVKGAFAKVKQVGADSAKEEKEGLDQGRSSLTNVPADTRVFKLTKDVFFPNAQRVKTQILDAVQTHHSAVYSTVNGEERERNWSVVGEQRVKRLRKRAGVSDVVNELPRLRVVVLDWTRVNHFDSTASLKLRELLNELKMYAGEGVEVRFVALNSGVKQRFERARPGWELIDGHESLRAAGNTENTNGERVVRCFRTVKQAVEAERFSNGSVDEILEEKMDAKHIENV